MKSKTDEIRALYDSDQLDCCIAEAMKIAGDGGTAAAERSEAYFIMGNAYRRMNNWRLAMNSYCEAMDLDPESPAKEAYDTIVEILDFYNHDLYNP